MNARCADNLNRVVVSPEMRRFNAAVYAADAILCADQLPCADLYTLLFVHDYKQEASELYLSASEIGIKILKQKGAAK